MGMVVKGISNGMIGFTSAANEIEVSQIAGGKLNVRILHLGMELFNENYYPQDGKVYIYELGDMLRENIDPVVPEGMSRTFDRYLAPHFPAEIIFSDDADTVPVSVNLFYCRCKTLVSPLDPVFFTHENTVRTAPGRMEHLTLYAANGDTSIDVGVAYLGEGRERYKTYTQSVTYPYLGCYSFAIEDVAKKAAVDLSAILYYDVILKENGTRKDKVRFINDKRQYRDITRFIYTNTFGLPETATFTGLTEYAPELEGDIVEMLRGNARPDARYMDIRTVNSGYVNATRYRKILDLITSPSVHIYDENRIDEVVITDIDFTHKRTGNEKINVSLTYRRVGRNHLEFGRTANIRTRIFDNTFDYTFN